MTSLHDLVRIALIGIGATAVLDLWLVFLKRFGVPTQSFAYIGRWAGHLLRGRFAHAAIARAEPVAGELAWGWLVHYAVGVAFAVLLMLVQGVAWIEAPSLLPAVLVGAGTVVMPLLVMQPAMGAGFASSKTATPIRNCLRSLTNHTVFGFGLYLAALVLTRIAQ